MAVATANDASSIVAEVDDLLRNREEEVLLVPSADEIFTRMSEYMGAPTA